MGVRDRVHFLGFQHNPHRFMKRATVFTSSSIFEGFGLVLVEALACGTPVVATNCLSGPAEVLADGEFGVLVPPKDPEGRAKGLKKLLTDPVERARLSKLGVGRAEVFGERSRMVEWEDLFLRFTEPRVHAYN